MEENKTILDLYENYIDEIYTMTTEKTNLSGKILLQENLLSETLTLEQKQILKKLNSYTEEKEEYVRKQVFIYAYKLATNLLLESLNDTTNE